MQNSLSDKLDRFYGRGKYTHNPQLVANVNASYTLCEELLGYLTYNPVMSVGKNVYNITYPAHGQAGAGARSSAFNGMRTHHHIARGAAVDAEHYEEAATVHRLITDIKALGGFDDYQHSVEFLLLACSMYMVHGTSDEHAKIMSATTLNARCQFAFFNALVRAGELVSGKSEIVEFLDTRGLEISDVVHREFRERTSGVRTAKVLAIAQTGAMELPVDHADYHKRCVPRLNGTVAEVDGATLRVDPLPGRFAKHAIHAWYLLTLTLHLGLRWEVARTCTWQQPKL